MAPDIDLTVLNLRVPVIDAVCATVCGDWLSAADLWFETFRDPPFRGLAARCGAEAALQAGLFDLAEYFYVGLAELADFPAEIVILRGEAEPVRQARRAYFQRRLDGEVAVGSLDGASELISLRFYPQAVRRMLVSPLSRSDPALVAPILARAYAGLGAHACLVDLWEGRKDGLGGADMDLLVSRARRLLRWRSDRPIDNVRRFEEGHAAGAVLTATLERVVGA